MVEVKGTPLILPWLALAAGCTMPSAGSSPAIDQTAQPAIALAAWQPGYLDIHHIQTGRGNAAFFVFPDSTTMLVDAGALQDDWDKLDRYRPLKLAPAMPDRTRRPGEWIADYIAQFAPADARGIDYALITHFHSDHFGFVDPQAPRSGQGDWQLSGITDVAERWPITTMIDRGFPDYDFPLPYGENADASLANYLEFVRSTVAEGQMTAEGFRVGREDQIRCMKDKAACAAFSVRNVAANGMIWSGAGSAAERFLEAEQITDGRGGFNENPLSTVIKVDYGDFDYVTGGDLTGVNEPDQPAWFAAERRIAPVIGEVDAMTLNHHGNRDATSAAWLGTLRPRVIVQQTWVSDHPGGEVVARMNSRKIWPGDRDIFATYVHPETQIAIGPWLTRGYQSLRGHVVIRVQPGGAIYKVFVLNERDPKRRIRSSWGPYHSNGDTSPME